MLTQARRKARRVGFAIGRAEQIPLVGGSIDYAVTTFAFHHFEDKSRALDEIRRVSSPGSAFRLLNIVPEEMPGWWVYRFFPKARELDAGRYWMMGRLQHELESRGYTVELQVRRYTRYVTMEDLVVEAERRDRSQLDILSDADYQDGLERLREAAFANTGARIQSESAMVDCQALLRI
jgi:SAM-dependent methyltransferase